MARTYQFTSESVSEGHPDKVCDTISDSILDACLAQDPRSRVACETFVKDNVVVVGGEITTPPGLHYEAIVREAIREIGYSSELHAQRADDGGQRDRLDYSCKFDADHFYFMNFLGQQSKDIAQGVDESAADHKETAEQGAGDQGIMFGYACNETPQLMPVPIAYAHMLGREITRMRKDEWRTYPWLRPDAKTQVSVEYVDGKPTRVTAVVISTMHSAAIDTPEIRDVLREDLVRRVIPETYLSDDTKFLINPTGRFVVGGPEGDSGLTGRKIIVDTYGGMGRHGGGAFSGKDPSKVDRSAAYMCRYVAKNIVAAGLADRCELQVAYAIGYPHPVSIHVETFGTAKVDDARIVNAISEVFSFKPADIVRELDLLRPIYRKTTNYGHFGREDDLEALRWERTDKAAALRQITGL
ncbi:MAG: methionine adenosyltransferase [Thiotrichales bacterium]